MRTTLWTLLLSASGMRVDRQKIDMRFNMQPRNFAQVTNVKQMGHTLLGGKGKGEICPVEVTTDGMGDPEKQLCCANEAALYTCRKMKAEEVEKWGPYFCYCDKCLDVESNFELVNRKVHKYYGGIVGGILGGSPTELTVTADLDPKITDGSLFADDAMFAGGRPYVLFLYPKADHNGAFAIRETLCQRLDCWRKRGYVVVKRIVGSVIQASALLSKFEDDSLHHVILGGHGSSDSLCFGIINCLQKNEPWTASFLFKLRKKLNFDGTVTLDACSNAHDAWFGLQNFFEYVASKLPGRQVVASKISLNDNMWKKKDDATCLAGDQVKFIAADGSNQTAIALPEHPNCKELEAEDIESLIESGGSCLSRCRKSCAQAEAMWAEDERHEVGAKLTRIETYTGRYNPCTVGHKQVCRISRSS